jgi:hypothetical protein
MLSLVVTKHIYGETVSVFCCLKEVGFLPLQKKDHFFTVTNIFDGFSFSRQKYRYFGQFILTSPGRAQPAPTPPAAE